MQPDLNQKKKNHNIFPVIILFLVSIFLLIIIFILRSEINEKTGLKKIGDSKNVPMPLLFIIGPSQGIVRKNYKSNILASLAGFNEDLEITADGIPEGLTLGNCDQQFDSEIIPKPNTITQCQIEGIPNTASFYQIILTATAGNYSTTKTMELQILNP